VDGFDVTLAGDGQVAIDLLKKSKPDAVLLDLMLPQVNGIEVVKFIRADDKLKKLPVIIFTNAYLGNMVQAAWKAGADKCLTKAICKPSQVVQLVRATIEERGAHAGTRKSKAAKPHSAGKGGSDEDDFRRRFLVDSPQILSVVRTRLQAVVKSETDTAYLHWLEERSNLLKEMYHVLHSLTGKAGAAGFGQVAQLSSALEAMLQELADTPQNTSSSVLRTFAHAVDFLALILSGATPAALNEHEKPVALLVDDEVFSRRAVISGLEKVGLSYVSMSSPAEALESESANRVA